MRRTKRHRVVLTILALLGYFVAPITTGTAQAQAVTACGGTFTADAFLTGDLDCTGFAGAGVTIDGSTLDLAGYTIIEDAADDAVQCLGSCRVFSSSTAALITGASRAIYSFGGVLDVDNVTVEGATWFGLAAADALRVTNVTVRNTVGTCVATGGRRLIVENALLENCGHDGIGIGSVADDGKHKLFVDGVTITGAAEHGIAMVNAGLRGSNLTIEGSGMHGIESRDSKVKLEACAIRANTGAGIYSREFFNGRGNVVIRDCDIAQNGSFGLRSGTKLKISASTLRQNTEGGIGGALRVGIRDTTIENNDRGAAASRTMKVKDSSVTGSLFYGLSARTKITLKNTNVTGNGTDVTCTPDLCSDVITGSNVVTKPGKIVLQGTSTCETSWDRVLEATQGVCTLD